MGEKIFEQTLRYIFFLSLLLIAVAYWAGTKNVLEAFFGGANTLILTSTGRTQSGNFANYPK